MEARHGVSGYRDTQDAIENVSTLKSEFDHMKGQTLEDMADMVQQFNSKIANKKAALEPILRELRTVRDQSRVSILTVLFLSITTFAAKIVVCRGCSYWV